MREAVYLILVLAGSAPAGAVETHDPYPKGPGRHFMPARLDLSMQAFDVPASPEHQQGTSPVQRDRASARPIPGVDPAPDRARGVLAWGLPAGWNLAAAAVFGSSAVVGQAAWPIGGTVPAVKASAAVSTIVSKANAPILNVNLSATRNWQLDAPLGGTYLDCTVVLDLSAAAIPKLSLRAPCDRAGHFGAALRAEF